MSWRATSRSPAVVPCSWSVTARPFGQRVDLRHGDDRPAGTAPADLEQALRLQDAQRLAQGGAGDAEHLGELVLGWEPLADGELAPCDLAPQALGHHLAGLGHPDLLVGRHRVIRADH